MDIDTLKRIAQTGEDSKHEFKFNIVNADLIASEMVAFANADGGFIYIGITDEGEIIGLEPEDVRRINQILSNAASQHIKSPLSIKTENLQLSNGKIIIIVEIPDGTEKPYFDRRCV